jgi:hypothetical protein
LRSIIALEVAQITCNRIETGVLTPFAISQNGLELSGTIGQSSSYGFGAGFERRRLGITPLRSLH